MELLLLLLLQLLPLLMVSSRISNNVLMDASHSSPFPPHFFFGTSSSALQYEGAYVMDGKSLSNWDAFAHKSGSISDGSTGDVAVDQYHRYQEDVELMESLGVNAHKISISWSRVLPNGKHGNINWKGIIYYKNLIDALLHKGIEPFVTITHFDHPQELEDKYQGWLSPEMQDEYAHLAEVCFKNLGDRVRYWITFNEPNIFATMAYLYGFWPPNRCSKSHANCTQGNSGKEPFIVGHNLILAHASAVNIYRNHYQQKQGGQIGVALYFNWYEPISNSTADKAAAMRAVSFSTNWFLDPIIYGVYPKEMRDLLGPILPEFSSSNLEILKSGLDFIGINHYATFYAKDCLFSTCETINGNSREEGFVVQTMLKNGVPISEKTGLDYLDVYPQGIEKVVTYTKEKYPNIPIHITENGYCDKTTSNSSMEEVLDDIKRVDFLAGYLNVLGNAIGKGADVRGYFVWSLLDNFEWTYGYSKRMGLHHVDRVTLRRTPKLSAKWYKQFIAENQRLKKKMLKTNY